MKNKFLSLGILGFGLALSVVIVTNGAFAQTVSVDYPIAELGNCKNKDACKAYCDDPSHIDACVTFAEKNGLMSSEQLSEAKQVQAALKKGVKPPACRGKEECDAYCEDSGHMKECVAFGEASGFLKGRELEDAKKMLVAIDNGATPPACRGKEACDVYCSEPDHIEACMTFAQAAGFMTPEEEQNSQKMMAALKKGVKPPACRGKEACDTYCAEPAHTDECIQFAVAAGFMTDKEAEIAKKTGGKGPGGCSSKDSCDAFCGNPDNQQACIDFGRENGMISEEEAGRMQEGQKKFRESMQNIPAEAEECLKTALGDDAFEKMKSGQAMPSRDTGEKMGSCFSQMGPPPGQQEQPREGQEQERMSSQEQRDPGTPFMPRIESGQEPPEGQRPPGGQFAPGTYPGPMMPRGERPPEGQFAPGTYPSQPPPEGTSGAYPNQPQQFVPGTQPVMPVPGETPPPPPPEAMFEAGGETVPGTPVPQVQPIEQTAPQSFHFDLNNSLAAVINAFRGTQILK